jgi:hypothetical protein
MYAGNVRRVPATRDESDIEALATSEMLGAGAT